MSRSKTLEARLAKYGIDPCADNSCIFGSPNGLGTNGGCRCVQRRSAESYALIQRLAEAFRDACLRIESLEADLRDARAKYCALLEHYNK